MQNSVPRLLLDAPYLFISPVSQLYFNIRDPLIQTEVYQFIYLVNRVLLVVISLILYLIESHVKFVAKLLELAVKTLFECR